MNLKPFAVIVTVLPAFATIAVTADSKATNPKLLTALTMQNVASVPGEKKAYDAILAAKTGPLARKKVAFRIEGTMGSRAPTSIPIGEDATDNAGRAHIDFALPDLAQGTYALKASYAGDDDMAPANVEAKLIVAKAQTSISLSDLIWGTIDDEPRPPYGMIGFSVKRQSDGKSLKKPLKIIVNGVTTPIVDHSDYHMVTLWPMEAPSWKVRVEFEGDESTVATSLDRTYTRPKK